MAMNVTISSLEDLAWIIFDMKLCGLGPRRCRGLGWLVVWKVFTVSLAMRLTCIWFTSRLWRMFFRATSASQRTIDAGEVWRVHVVVFLPQRSSEACSTISGSQMILSQKETTTPHVVRLRPDVDSVFTWSLPNGHYLSRIPRPFALHFCCGHPLASHARGPAVNVLLLLTRNIVAVSSLRCGTAVGERYDARDAGMLGMQGLE